MTFSKTPISLAILASLSLTGCIEVDDDSNDEVVVALNQQNQILADQNALLNQQIEDADEAKFHATVAGIVMGADSQAPIGGATIQIMKGTELIAESTANESGQFTIEDLPSSTDLTVVVESADNAFVKRAFFIRTSTVFEADVYNDIGQLVVSVPTTSSLTILNGETGEPIEGLEFVGFSHSGTGRSTVLDYAHKSTFNEETGAYDIVLPRDFNITLEANLDLDGDGDIDFDIIESGNGNLVGRMLRIFDAVENETLELTLGVQEDDVDAEVETKNVSITLIDENGLPLSDAAFLFTDGEEDVASTFNAESSLHNLTVPFDGYVSLNMASFVEEEVTYSSGYISLDRSTDSQTGETTIVVRTSGFDSRSAYIIPDTENIQLVVVARSVTPSSDVQVITSNFDASDNYEYTVYYSEPVTIPEEEVTLTYDEIAITAGNASTTDSIPSGTTVIERVERESPVTITSELNGTRYVFAPEGELETGTDYNYNVGFVSAVSDGISVDLSDSRNFTTSVSTTGEFSIASLLVDNNNYYSNGAILVNETTAGVTSTVFEFDRTATLYLPVEIEQLNYLNITVTGYTENNVENVYTRFIEVVSNNNVNYSKRLAVSAAEEEQIENRAFVNQVVGSTLSNGEYVYGVSTGVYIGDNKAGDVNEIDITYEYQLPGAEAQTGQLTLPVR